jgi:signal transduction histidine kinase
MPDAKRDQLFNGQQQGTAAATHADHASDGQAAPTTQISAVSPAAWLDIVRRMLLFLGLGCFVFAIWRHALLYHHSPSPAGYAILCGIVLFGEALVTQSVWVVYGLSFWLSHAQEFIGFAVISYAVLGAYRRGQAEGLLESLLLPGTRAHIQAEYALAMDSLVDALARGEQPAPSLRQALRGPFGMSENQMRVLERAATAVAQERQQRQELERLNEALRQLEQARTDLTHMVVHDLKTPLTAQIGFLELLQMSPLAEDERMLLEGALRSSMTLSRLITDMLDVARLESGRLELDWSSFRACELLEGCAAEVRGWLAKECKTIQIELSDATPLLYADRHIVRRVMLNLVSNAIKHTPDGTCITLRAVPAGPLSLESGTAHMPADLDGCSASDMLPTSVVLEVEDTGAGIAPRDLERIFAKFERIDNAGGRRQDSTGLGLTFCRLAVEAHGGTLSVSSVVGVGTVFRVVLPGVGSV